MTELHQDEVSERVAVAITGTDLLGESPCWSAAEQRLYWVDTLAPALIEGDPASGTRNVVRMPEPIGCIAPRATGGFVMATKSGIKRLVGGVTTTLAEPERDRPGNRFNDGKCDRAGRFWAGSVAVDGSPDQGALWRLDTDGTTHCMVDNVHVGNGLGWSPDDCIFYFTDSGRRTIYAYDFDLHSGEIANRRVFARPPEAGWTPDGLTVDRDGFIWSATWDGWCVIRYDPNGKVDKIVTLPVPRPTSCAFGGSALDTLYVTTARLRLSARELDEAPLSGSVFAIDAGAKGLSEPMFGG